VLAERLRHVFDFDGVHELGLRGRVVGAAAPTGTARHSACYFAGNTLILSGSAAEGCKEARRFGGRGGGGNGTGGGPEPPPVPRMLLPGRRRRRGQRGRLVG